MSVSFRPAAIFGDHMVLRSGVPALIFGEAEDGARINATLNGRSVAAAARAGRFELQLPPMDAGGPHTLTLTDGSTAYTFADVLFGEVYLAGGQSNMELELQNSDDGALYAARADFPNVRYYNVLKAPVWNAQAEADERKTLWRALSRGEGGDMSAVAFHFATRLSEKLGVPVGIIDCYWGGTSAVCWMDERGLRATVEGTALLTAFDASIAHKTQAECDTDVRLHDEAVEAWNRKIELRRAEDPQRRWPEIAALVGPCPWNPPHSRKSPFRPMGLAETMLMRAAPYTLSGFLYYQGEEDTKHAGLYRALMSALILCWRRLFRDETLPFLFVQLPMFRDSSQQDDLQWAVLREMQQQTFQSISRTGLAVMIDGGELDNIHPTDKKTVGERLFREALRVAYGGAEEPQSPRALYAYREGSELVILLSEAVTAGGEPALFEMTGETGVVVPACAHVEGKSLRLSAANVAEPSAARYAWVNYGAVNVFGASGLPLAPFLIRATL